MTSKPSRACEIDHLPSHQRYPTQRDEEGTDSNIVVRYQLFHTLGYVLFGEVQDLENTIWESSIGKQWAQQLMQLRDQW